MDYPFGQFAPDAGELAPGVMMDVSGVLPLRDGYGPLKGWYFPNTGSSGIFPGTLVKGMVSLRLRDGTRVVYAGSDTDWHKLNADWTWGSGLGGGTFNVTSGDYWSFLHFGNYLLGTNTTDGMQAYNVETPAGISYVSAAGDPRQIFSCGNVVVGLDCKDDSGNRDNRLIRNSAINDHTNWTTRGADIQPLEDGGALIVGRDITGNAAFIGQENAIRIMQFGDAPGGALYSLYKAVDGVGPVSANATVVLGRTCFFPTLDGFARYTFGAAEVDRIGAGRIDRWWLNRVDQTRLGLMQAAVDPENKVIWWVYPDQTYYTPSLEGLMAEVIGYHWQLDKWTRYTLPIYVMGQISTPGYTLEDMDAFGPLDSINTPLDDRFWQGSAPLFLAIGLGKLPMLLSGPNMLAQFTTGTVNSAQSMLVRSATPVTDGPMTVALGVKDKLSDTLTWKPAVATQPSGRAPLWGRGKNVAFNGEIAASSDWTYATGIDHVELSTGGPR